MKYVSILIFWICSINAALSQITINLTTPANTPTTDSIYIAGNFNNWNPNNNDFRLTQTTDYKFTITFNPAPGNLEFKFTRGSWGNVEGTQNGGFIPNRTYTYTGNQVTIDLTVLGWEDNSAVHTASPQVHILDEAFDIPQLGRERRVWVYLPVGYDTSSLSYPVFYLQDGQNLFDRYYSFAGEWRVDESMDSLALITGKNSIVIGIDNGEGERINEYSPWVNSNYGGGDGEKYASFIVNTLKPYVDSHYRTLKDRNNTGIGGSSMGALIAFYTALQYNDVFSKAGVLSPSFWFSDSVYTFASQFKNEYPTRFFFIAGEQESQTMIPDMQRMKDLLLTKNVSANNINLKSYPGGHNESFWAAHYPEVYEWLFGQNTSKNKVLDPEKDTMIYPNPVSDKFKVDCTIKNHELIIFDLNQNNIGRIKQDADGYFHVRNLSSGVYFFKGMNEKTNSEIVIKVIKL